MKNWDGNFHQGDFIVNLVLDVVILFSQLSKKQIIHFRTVGSWPPCHW